METVLHLVLSVKFLRQTLSLFYVIKCHKKAKFKFFFFRTRGLLLKRHACRSQNILIVKMLSGVIAHFRSFSRHHLAMITHHRLQQDHKKTKQQVSLTLDLKNLQNM